MTFISVFLFLTSAGPADLADTSVTDSSGVNYWMQDTNRIELWITNTGIIANNIEGTDFGCGWPKGEGRIYFTRTGFWFGTIDTESDDTLVSIGYGFGYYHLGGREFRPGAWGQDPKSEVTRIYRYPDRWPPNQDSYPAAPARAISHQDSWCVFNDSAPIYHDARPIGIEVYQTGLAWNYTLAQDMVYVVFEARNITDHALTRNYFGINVELHIGSCMYSNDIVCSIPSRRYRFAGGDSAYIDDIGYGWQEEPEPDWDPPVPGVVGFDFVQTPFDLHPGCDKDHDGIPDQYERDSVYYCQSVPRSKWDADSDYIPDWRDASQNPQVGMSSFMRQILYAPLDDPERYRALAGYNYQTGVYQPFDTIPSVPDEHAFIMGSGPFDLMPDSSAILVVGIVLADWYQFYETPDTALALIDRWSQRIWDEFYFEPGVGRLPGPVYGDSNLLVAAPNPSTRRAIAHLTLAESREVTLELFDVCGRKVHDQEYGTLGPGAHELVIRVWALPAGTYFILCRLDGVQAAPVKLMLVK